MFAGDPDNKVHISCATTGKEKKLITVVLGALVIIMRYYTNLNVKLVDVIWYHILNPSFLIHSLCASISSPQFSSPFSMILQQKNSTVFI